MGKVLSPPILKALRSRAGNAGEGGREREVTNIEAGIISNIFNAYISALQLEGAFSVYYLLSRGNLKGFNIYILKMKNLKKGGNTYLTPL